MSDNDNVTVYLCDEASECISADKSQKQSKLTMTVSRATLERLRKLGYLADFGAEAFSDENTGRYEVRLAGSYREPQ